MINKIVGISSMCGGITRIILVIDNVGIVESFSDSFFYYYLFLYLIGMLVFIYGDKK